MDAALAGSGSTLLSRKLLLICCSGGDCGCGESGAVDEGGVTSSPL